MYKKPSRSSCLESMAPPAGPSGREAGFSFIELMISVSLFAFLVVGVLTMNSAYIKYNSDNKFYATAVQLAENGIESYMQLPYAALNGKSDTQGFDQIPGFANYARIIAVENYTADTCTIRARAAWRARGGTNLPTNPNRWPIEISVVRSSL